MGNQPVAMPLPIHRIDADRHAYLELRFEPTFPVFKRAKAVHVLGRAATVIGN
jgi:hypothetical protein